MAEHVSTSARTKGIGRLESGDLDLWGGIVAGRLTQYAQHLGIDTADVLPMVEAEGIDLMVDTGIPKNRETDRPTDPELRSLAMRRADLNALEEAAGKNGSAPTPTPSS